ncbi:MAG: hypothetical protein VX938_02260, partial [Myxococcota bacterium]|nr:hypothetical protein [Myxococcota bacterium]
RCADLASFEAALSHPGSTDGLAEDLSPREGTGDLWRVPCSVELLRVEHDVDEPSCALLDEPLFLALWRRADGDVHVAELEAPVWEALEVLKRSGEGRAPEGLQSSLLELAELRLIQPVTWTV